MAEHKATIKWTLSQGDFLKGAYSREHTWTFDGGMTVAASSSPAAVRVPFSNPANADPEEAFVASLSSCHMLTYLFIASRKGFEVTSYEDEAVGVMTNNEKGTPWVSAVTLHPRITYAPKLRRPLKRVKCTTLHTTAASLRIPSRPKSK